MVKSSRTTRAQDLTSKIIESNVSHHAPGVVVNERTCVRASSSVLSLSVDGFQSVTLFGHQLLQEVNWKAGRGQSELSSCALIG